MNPTKTTSLQAQLAKLFGRINYERRNELKPFDFKLDGINEVLQLLDQPHLKYPVIHVAGTKGKGSVAKMIAAVLSEGGKRTGVYTSPHLETINQRISVDDKWISDDELGNLLCEIQPALESVDEGSRLAGIRPLSFFEVITTAAFYHFAKTNCEAVVLEVGMGGRLDSTNVCSPQLCVITNISMDHTRQLGDSLDKIAVEKAGIIKPGVPLVCGETKLQPKQIIHQVAQANGSEILQRNEHFAIDFAMSNELSPQELTFNTWGRVNDDFEWALDDVRLAMLGRHQAVNGATAVASVQRLIHDGWDISDQEIRDGLAKVRLPGRAELVSSAPPVVIDMAHNVASIEALIQTLEQHFPRWNNAKRKRLVVAISSDKDFRGIFRWLVDTFDEIVLTKYESNPRGKPVEQLYEIAEVVRDGLQTDTKILTAENPSEAWSKIRSDLVSGDFICIAGSVFLAAEMRPLVAQWSKR